jgi:hypothetical protein
MMSSVTFVNIVIFTTVASVIALALLQAFEVI